MSISSSMKRTNELKLNLGSITLTAMLLAILVVQEELLSLLPNVQLTTLLIMVYASILPLSLFISLTVGYVFLDSLLMGSLNPVYMIPMFFSWILLGLVTRKFKNKPLWVLLVIATAFGFIYGWSFIPSKMIMFEYFKLWPYLASDILFEVIMAVSNFVTVAILYLPLKKLFTQLTSEMRQ